MIRRLVWAAVHGVLSELDSRSTAPSVVVVPVVVQAPAPPPPTLPAVLADDDCDDCDCCGHDDTPNPDRGRRVTHQLPAEGLWHLLVRAARHAANGEDVETAATLVMAEIDCEHTEANVDIDPEDP